jgi:hypothetical protein
MSYSKGGNTLVLRVVENHMPSWDVIGKGKCYQLVLKLQAKKNIDQP